MGPLTDITAPFGPPTRFIMSILAAYAAYEARNMLWTARRRGGNDAISTEMSIDLS